jgi:1-acyl-sn-glycerol-3-phosphate acyltransferase
MRFAYHGVGPTLARYLSLRCGTTFRGEIRSEYPEVSRFLAAYLCWRFDAVFMGIENIPTSGGILLVGNHQQVFDGPLVLHGARSRDIRLLVKNDGENRLGLSLLRLLTGALTINRSTGDLASVEMVENILRREGAVCMFPEGHRTEDGKVMGFHPGVAMIARHAPNARIAPFGITNAQDLRFRTVVKNLDRGIHRKRKPTIRFGPSFQLPTASLPKRKQRGKDVSLIRRRVLDLLPEGMEGADELYVI